MEKEMYTLARIVEYCHPLEPARVLVVASIVPPWDFCQVEGVLEDVSGRTEREKYKEKEGKEMGR